MATSEVLIKSSPSVANIVLANSGDYSGDLGDQTDQIDLTSLAALAARQSAKVDLGATRAPLYSVFAAIEFATAPVVGETIDFYWSPSPSVTAATANAGGASGADAAYDGYSANLADSLKQLEFIGSLVLTVQATTTVQFGLIGLLVPRLRYGSLIVVNSSAADNLLADAVEMGVLLHPIVEAIQAAA